MMITLVSSFFYPGQILRSWANTYAQYCSIRLHFQLLITLKNLTLKEISLSCHDMSCQLSLSYQMSHCAWLKMIPVNNRKTFLLHISGNIRVASCSKFAVFILNIGFLRLNSGGTTLCLLVWKWPAEWMPCTAQGRNPRYDWKDRGRNEFKR